MDNQAVYRIRIRGSLPESCYDLLGGMRIATVTPAVTTLEGWLPDQAALKGLLDTLYERRLPLLEVIRLPDSRHATKSTLHVRR